MIVAQFTKVASFIIPLLIDASINCRAVDRGGQYLSYGIPSDWPWQVLNLRLVASVTRTTVSGVPFPLSP